MTVEKTLARLKSVADEKVRARNERNGLEGDQFGVPMGEIRKVAKEIKTDHELGLALWETGNLDARLVAILVIVPEELSSRELSRLVKEASFPQLADWLNAYVVKNHPDKETLRRKWMSARDPWHLRAGWNLTAERVGKDTEGLDVPALLDRIEAEMAKAKPPAQWTMNNCLAAIGIHMPEHRERALAIGEALGVYRDYPVSKGCTSPFAPIWIHEMVSRQG